MSLPKHKYNTFTIKLNELDKPLKYRQFVVAEQKKLYEIIDLGYTDSNNAMYDIIKECTFNKIDVDGLAGYLIDFIFLQLYIKSIENKTSSIYECRNMVYKTIKPKKENIEDVVKPAPVVALPDDIAKSFEEFNNASNKDEIEDAPKEPEKIYTACATQLNVVVPIDQAKIIYPENFSLNSVIDVDNETKLYLKFPSGKLMQELVNDPDCDNKVLFSSILYIESNGEKLVPGVDFTLEELKEWIDEITTDVSKKIVTFFQDSPYLGLKLKITCPECGKEEEIDFRGIESFFV